MPIHFCGCNATTRCAHQVSLLDQIRFDHIFYGIAFFTDRGRQVLYPDRTTVEFFDNRQQQAPIHDIKTQRIDLEQFQCSVTDLGTDRAIGFHFGIIAHPA